MNRCSRFGIVVSVLTALVSIESQAARGRTTITIEPARPTHYFYTPTAYLNTEFDMVGSLHEAAFTLPYHFQALASIVDNVGRLCFGARYGFLENLSLGAGLAWSFSSFPYEGHGIKHSDPHPRFGLFLVWGPVLTDRFEISITPHLQAGYHFSMGCDIGMMITPSDYWSLIGEFGFSFDFNDALPYFNTVWGARIHPPQIPFLSFDGGLDFVENPPDKFAQSVYAFRPFLDAIFTMKTMR